jgi:hypothetical protein
MWQDYIQIINNFHASSKSILQDTINHDDIDSFLETLTNIYVSMLEKGAAAFDADSAKFKNELTNIFFAAGLTCIKQAMMPEKMEIIFEYLFVQKTSEQTVCRQELFEMYLLKKMMPLLLPEASCLKKYLYLLAEFCSGKKQYFLLSKFVKFIEIFNLEDCDILKEVRP